MTNNNGRFQKSPSKTRQHRTMPHKVVPRRQRKTPHVVLTDHAVNNYRKRLHPELNRKTAWQHLRALLGQGRFTKTRPEWLLGELPAAAYLVFEDMVLPLQSDGQAFVATTTVARYRP